MSLTELQRKAAGDIAYYDRLAREYFQRHEQPIQRFTTRLETKWLREIVQPGSRVLLVGSGGGREIAALLALRCKVTALDYSQPMIEQGRARWADHDIHWVCGDAHNLADFECQFDCVITLAAINYFVDAPLAMKQMRNALRDGGTLIVSSINALHPTERRKSSAGGKYNRKAFTSVELRDMAAEAGLRICEIRGFRHLVDRLSPQWNGNAAAWWKRWLLGAALLYERLLTRFRDPGGAKFLWLIAQR